MSRKENKEFEKKCAKRIYLAEYVIAVDQIAMYRQIREEQCNGYKPSLFVGIKIVLNSGYVIELNHYKHLYNGVKRLERDWEFLVQNCPLTFNPLDEKEIDD